MTNPTHLREIYHNVKAKLHEINARLANQEEEYLKEQIQLLENIQKDIDSKLPLDMGFEHWQQNMQEFKTLSHIENLQNATQEKITTNVGFEPIALESTKSIVADVIDKQLPTISDENIKINEAKERFKTGTKRTQVDMNRLEESISETRINLRNFATNYFTDLFLQLQGTSLETFGDFLNAR